ncbi:MAG: TIM barrel protein [Syntrophobacterales bacterium]|nr:MAG: TIM barrel protein [Syntrophobacterales bacterium]
MIGLSTAWFTEREGITGCDVVGEIVELGFKGMELEYRVTETMYREMQPMILKGKVKVMSIHNFFPLPDDVPLSRASGDRFLLSSPEREERDLAIRMTIRTIECAQHLGAAAVILHLGKVDMETENERLYDLFNRQRLDGPEGRLFLEDKLNERREKRGPHLESVFFSLDQLNHEAEKRGILLGVENRYYYHEIPDFEEIGLILDRFSGGSIRYWHDMGHAHVLERLGIVESGSLLQSYAPHNAGIHIHDAIGTDDHLAPGAGEIDFMDLADRLRSARIKILEVHKKSDRLELMNGSDMVQGIGII